MDSNKVADQRPHSLCGHQIILGGNLELKLGWDSIIIVVAENKKEFTKQQIQHAKAARALCHKLRFPSIKDCKWVIQSNQIKDCPITVQDFETSIRI